MRNQCSTPQAAEAGVAVVTPTAPRALLLLALTLSLMVPLSTAVSAADDTESVAATRDAVARWVEARRVISRERSDWVLGREMLNERIELLRREIGALRTRVDGAMASLRDAQAKRLELLAENKRLEQASGVLTESVVALETRTKGLLGRLPDPLVERVEPLSQRLPRGEVPTRLSLSERFQNVVGILNEANRFQREITVTSEVRRLSDGAAAEVAAMYAGIGQAWYCSGDGHSAGVGRTSPEGWVWTPADGAATAIGRAIAILQNEAVAEFVRLPVNVD